MCMAWYGIASVRYTPIHALHLRFFFGRISSGRKWIDPLFYIGVEGAWKFSPPPAHFHNRQEDYPAMGRFDVLNHYVGQYLVRVFHIMCSVHGSILFSTIYIVWRRVYRKLASRVYQCMQRHEQKKGKLKGDFGETGLYVVVELSCTQAVAMMSIVNGIVVSAYASK